MRRPMGYISIILCAIALAGCSSPQPARYDANVSVPKGDPAFPKLADSWVIDKAGILSPETIRQGDAICQKLKEDGVAEVVLVTMNGVKQPDLWATHYGRWLGLGKKGLSTKGGNKGVVWLIRPDSDLKMTVSVGRGLPEFASPDFGRIMDDSKDYINYGNFDRGALALLKGTDKRLRELNSEGKD